MNEAAKTPSTSARVLLYLRMRCVGRINAARAIVVANELGLTWRQVEAAVEEIRNSEVFVASARTGCPRGLYLPATDDEWRDALGSFRRATLTQITTYNRLKRARRVAALSAGQQFLF